MLLLLGYRVLFPRDSDEALLQNVLLVTYLVGIWLCSSLLCTDTNWRHLFIDRQLRLDEAASQRQEKK